MKILFLCIPMTKSCKCGIGYLSGTVFALKFLKSLQGCHALVSGFWTICSSEEYGLLEGRMMLNSNKRWNSTFAILHFSGCSLYGHLPLIAKTIKIRWCKCGWSSGCNIMFSSVANLIRMFKSCRKSWKFFLSTLVIHSHLVLLHKSLLTCRFGWFPLLLVLCCHRREIA